jgi:hypothetical protein
MSQADSFHQILVEPQGAGDVATDLGNLQHVTQSGSEVVPGGCDEHLRLCSEPSEGVAVNDAIPVSLVGRSHWRLRFR